MSSGDQGRFPAASEGVLAVSCPWHSRPAWPPRLSTLFPTSPAPAFTSSPPATFREFKSISGVKGCQVLSTWGEARPPALCPGEPRSTTGETEARGQVGGGVLRALRTPPPTLLSAPRREGRDASASVVPSGEWKVRPVGKGSCQPFSAPSPPLAEGESGQESVLVGSQLPLLHRGAASSPSPFSCLLAASPSPHGPQTPAAVPLQL